MVVAIDLSGSTALVTGASGGIGAVIAQRLAEAGAFVWIHHHANADAAAITRRAVTAAGGRAAVVQADLSRADDRTRLFAEVGELDVLVNNAGIYPSRPLLQITDDEWAHVFAVNTTATFVCLRAAAASMTDRNGRRTPGPSIVNITSISAWHPAPAQAHYAASKAAVLALTRAAAQELGPAGIRVNAVSPGLVDRPTLATDWPEGLHRWTERAPLGRAVAPAGVADACLFLASPLAASITGHELVVDGGIHAAPAY
jgi:3-oxoacyl-[acyl-carrier protein] reductase